MRRALERHRDDPPPRLQFDVPLDRLMDAHYCRTLRGDLDRLVEGGWEVARATKSAWRMIPNKPGLYMFVWRPAFELPMMAPPLPERMPFCWVLYVGRTGHTGSQNTLRKRYRQEYSNLVAGDPDALWAGDPPRGRSERLRRYLSVVPLEFWYAVVLDAAAIAELERRLYNLFAPPLNAAGGPRLRPVAKGTKAF